MPPSAPPDDPRNRKAGDEPGNRRPSRRRRRRAPTGTAQSRATSPGQGRVADSRETAVPLIASPGSDGRAAPASTSPPSELEGPPAGVGEPLSAGNVGSPRVPERPGGPDRQDGRPDAGTGSRLVAWLLRGHTPEPEGFYEREEQVQRQPE